MAPTPSSTSTQGGRNEDTVWKSIWRWNAPVIHMALCVVVAICLFITDGYKALDGPGRSRRSNGDFTFRSSDIITLLSAAMILLGWTAARWSGIVLWKCAYLLWDETADTTKRLKKVEWILEYKFPQLPFKRVWNRIRHWSWDDTSHSIRLNALLLVLVFPIIAQIFSPPLLEGSVDWSSSSDPGLDVVVQSGSPTANFARWRWYSSGSPMAVADINAAAGLAGIAWENSTLSNDMQQNKRCRHVVNDNRLVVGSTVRNATLPCIIINNITWPKTSMSPAVQRFFNDSSLVSVSGGNPFLYSDAPGIAILFDPTNRTLRYPPVLGVRNSSVLAPIATPIYPSNFLYSGKMTVIIQLIKNYAYEPRLLDPFGYTEPNNKIDAGRIPSIFASGFTPEASYTYLEVDLTAGIINPGVSTYVTSKVIESGPEDPNVADIQAGPWVKESLDMISDVMATIATMNNTSLDTWQNIHNYTENLIRFAYLSSWDMLQRKFDQGSRNLTATLIEPRLQASVNKPRVIGWLVIHVVFVLTSVVMFILEQRKTQIKHIKGPKEFIEKVHERSHEEIPRDGEGDSDIDNSGNTSRETPIHDGTEKKPYEQVKLLKNGGG